MFYFDEDFDENGFDEPAIDGGGVELTMGENGIAKQQAGVADGHVKAHGHGSGKGRFSDSYRMVDDELGSGAYACVRTAISLDTGKEYAVKLVDKHEPGHTHSRIRREVEIFKMCKDHPNIVQLIEWFEDANLYYMVFEKMHGGPLLNKIQRTGCFTELEASQVTRDIASALKFLHDKGIAHRDVKPENVLCIDKDTVSPVKLCDLDLASKPVLPKIHRGSGSGGSALHLVQSEPNLASPVGSAEFMAPEVVDAFVGDSLKYDKRCDMWSLGVIIYIMLCGYPPFYGECERDNCGWDQGKACPDCQDNLFHRIQRGEFDFPDEEWASVSDEAKDIIAHLLVRNVRMRYTADDVLRHPWVRHGGAPDTHLQTANNLSRNDSTRDMHQMNEHFNTIKRRLTAVHLSTRLETVIQESSSGIGTSVEQSPAGSPPDVKSIAAPTVEEISLRLKDAALEESQRASCPSLLEKKVAGEDSPTADEYYPDGHYVPPSAPPSYFDTSNIAVGVESRSTDCATFALPDGCAYNAPLYSSQAGHFIDSQGRVIYCVPPQNCSYPVMMMNNHHHQLVVPPMQVAMDPPGSAALYYDQKFQNVAAPRDEQFPNAYSQGQSHHQSADPAWQLNGGVGQQPGMVYFVPPPSPFFYYAVPAPTDMVHGLRSESELGPRELLRVYYTSLS